MSDAILNELRAAILRGEYSPRQRLVEAELASDYSTSRFIARKALVQLASEGLVELQPNRGARIREISVEEAIALTEARMVLEGLVAARAAERAGPEDVAHLRAISSELRHAVEKFEVIHYSEVNDALHTALRTIADHDPVTRILEQLNALVAQYQFVLALVPGRPAVALREHLEVIDAICSHDPEAAEASMRSHMKSVISTLETFRDGGDSSTSGIRELARKVKPRSSRNSFLVAPKVSLSFGSESPSQVLDLYLPDDEYGPFPLILSIHGGAFMMGDRTWELTSVGDLLEAGFAVASVDYRLSAEAPFPAAINDVKQAAAFLRRNASEWNLDPSFFVAWGRSAGGYLAAMLGVTTGQKTEFDTVGDDSSVSAVVDWYGPSDFLVMDDQFAAEPPSGDGPPAQAHNPGSSPESRFLGAPLQDVPEVAARANPIRYLDGTTKLPAFFLASGTNDRLVPYRQTTILADALRAQGAEVVVRILKGANHADHQFETLLGGPVVEWLKSLRASS